MSPDREPTPWEEMTPTERAVQRRRLDLIVERALRDEDMKWP
jgi:hypothetical protein